MLRWLVFIILLGFFGYVGAWVADQPGIVKIKWLGWLVDSSVGILFAVGIIFSIFVAILYRFYLFLRRAPSEISNSWRNRRYREGYKAITKGMVAIAAGDVEEAKKNAERAQRMLDNPPLTMLLSAQAAQLNGDDQAAEKFFNAMRGNNETALLGLRGLLTQATKKNNNLHALELAREAYSIRPKSLWVAKALFKLQIKHGLWADAKMTNKEMGKNKLIDPRDANRHQSVLSYGEAMQFLEINDKVNALYNLTIAVKNSPDFIPGVIELAHLLLNAGSKDKTIKAIENAWKVHPHPDLIPLYMEARGAVSPSCRAKAVKLLISLSPSHPESLIAWAKAALDAQLWGEARSALCGDIGEPKDPDVRVCQLMADLEEGERKDSVTSRKWLNSRGKALQEPAWICSDCGNAVVKWTIYCGSCDGFNVFNWSRPKRIGANTEILGVKKNNERVSNNMQTKNELLLNTKNE